MSKLRHFLDIDRLDLSILRSILEQAARFKNGQDGKEAIFKGKTLVMMFEKPSTRTRVSFEVGMQQLGGNVVAMSEKDS